MTHVYYIIWENLISVCFDGTSTMTDSTAGVQTKFKEKKYLNYIF